MVYLQGCHTNLREQAISSMPCLCKVPRCAVKKPNFQRGDRPVSHGGRKASPDKTDHTLVGSPITNNAGEAVVAFVLVRPGTPG